MCTTFIPETGNKKRGRREVTVWKKRRRRKEKRWKRISFCCSSREHNRGKEEGRGRRGRETSRRIQRSVRFLFFTRSHFERQPRREHNRSELASACAISLDCSSRPPYVRALNTDVANAARIAASCYPSCFSYVTPCQRTDFLIYEPFFHPCPFPVSLNAIPFIVPLSQPRSPHAPRKGAWFLAC